jgi:hypothetical protein
MRARDELARPTTSVGTSTRPARSPTTGAFGQLPLFARGAAAVESEYDEYSRRVTASIIASRLYHADDLKTFLRRALDDARYAHLDQAELKARTDEIAAEFFVSLNQ